MEDYLRIVQQFEKRNPPDVKKDQFFVINPTILETIIETAGITKEDRILEVGAGLGFLTGKLAERAKEIVTIEIDTRFTSYLSQLPSNVKILYGDAYRILRDKAFRQTLKPTKVVSNIPYSQAQNMLHNYTDESWYNGDIVWLAPLSLVNKVNNEPILGAYFKAQVIKTIGKSNFYPKPNTTSAIIYFKRIKNPIITKDFQIFLRRFLYRHENWKVKNAIREGIIQAGFALKNARVTKNHARKLIADLSIPETDLEVLTNNIRPEYYFEIPEKLQNWFDSL